MNEEVVTSTRKWVENVVIELNLCPFAKREWVKNRVRIKHSEALDHEALLQDLVVELALLSRKPEVETTLLVHPSVLTDFDDYNQFLNFADMVIEQMSLEGVYQVASFHPSYQFAGTEHDDPENYTNRSPYPMLHILRESSLEAVIDVHPNTDEIPLVNIERLRRLGADHMRRLLSSCHE